MRASSLAVLLILLSWPLASSWAAAPAATDKQTAASAQQRIPLLQLHGNALDGATRTISVDQLDGLAGNTEWVVHDPYRQRDVHYSGIQLRDLVAALAPLATQVRMRAVNDYITVFERKEWEKLPILLATRDEGQRMTVADKGPARIVYHNTLDNQLRMQVHAPKWIWQVIDVEFIGP